MAPLLCPYCARELYSATSARFRVIRQFLAAFEMVKNDGQWQILVMRNLDLTAILPENSADSTINH